MYHCFYKTKMRQLLPMELFVKNLTLQRLPAVIRPRLHHTFCALLVVLCGGIFVHAANETPAAAFAFKEAKYFHRWSQADQHEFTPEQQEDLEHWTDMMTVNGYPSVHDGEALATTANAVLENYKKHGARVLRTNSKPATPDRPAEHLIAVAFARPGFFELVFARLKMIDGEGCSLVYSHRIYGEKVDDEADAWLKANGEQTEAALMAWDSMPSPKTLRATAL